MKQIKQGRKKKKTKKGLNARNNSGQWGSGFFKGCKKVEKEMKQRGSEEKGMEMEELTTRHTAPGTSW